MSPASGREAGGSATDVVWMAESGGCGWGAVGGGAVEGWVKGRGVIDGPVEDGTIPSCGSADGCPLGIGAPAAAGSRGGSPVAGRLVTGSAYGASGRSRSLLTRPNWPDPRPACRR